MRFFFPASRWIRHSCCLLACYWLHKTYDSWRCNVICFEKLLSSLVQFMSNYCRDCFQCFCCIHCPNPNKPHLSYPKQPVDSNWSLDYPQYAFGMHVVWQNIFITRGFLDQKVRIQINPIKCCLRLLGEFRFAAASARPFLTCHLMGAYDKQGAKTRT